MWIRQSRSGCARILTTTSSPPLRPTAGRSISSPAMPSTSLRAHGEASRSWIPLPSSRGRAYRQNDTAILGEPYLELGRLCVASPADEESSFGCLTERHLHVHHARAGITDPNLQLLLWLDLHFSFPIQRQDCS